MARIKAAIMQLRDQPSSGYRTNDLDIRAKLVGRYPYKIFYRVRGYTVEIVRTLLANSGWLAESSTYAGKSARIAASVRTETGSLSFPAQP
jgi:plasmid stabilization system protein ParE